MKSETPTTPSPDPKPAEKQPWTPPKIKKMDIEETAIGIAGSFDADGMS